VGKHSPAGCPGVDLICGQLEVLPVECRQIELRIFFRREPDADPLFAPDFHRTPEGIFMGARVHQGSLNQVLVPELKKMKGLRVSYAPYEKSRRMHRVLAQCDEQAQRLSADECERRLLDGDPRIAVLRRQPQGSLLPCSC
jgi:hypothetical protein